jgi:hypothetical protein
VAVRPRPVRRLSFDVEVRHGEEVVEGSGQVRRADQREAADAALRRQFAQLRVALRALVAAVAELGVAGGGTAGGTGTDGGAVGTGAGRAQRQKECGEVSATAGTAGQPHGDDMTTAPAALPVVSPCCAPPSAGVPPSSPRLPPLRPWRCH